MHTAILGLEFPRLVGKSSGLRAPDLPAKPVVRNHCLLSPPFHTVDIKNPGWP